MATKKEVNLLAENKPSSIKLADGNEYTLPPITLTTLANVEKTMGFGLAQFSTKLESETVTTLRALIYALLKESYPNMTIEQVGDLVTLKELNLLSDTITQIMRVTV